METPPTDAESIAKSLDVVMESLTLVRPAITELLTPTLLPTLVELTADFPSVVMELLMPTKLAMMETMSLVMVVILLADLNVVTEISRPPPERNVIWELVMLTLLTLAEPTASSLAVVMVLLTLWRSVIPELRTPTRLETLAEPTADFPTVVMVSSIPPTERNVITELPTLIPLSTDALSSVFLTIAVNDA
jgi:hypothetical protein